MSAEKKNVILVIIVYIKLCIILLLVMKKKIYFISPDSYDFLSVSRLKNKKKKQSLIFIIE